MKLVDVDVKIPHLIFFEPTDEFLRFVVQQADGRPVVDVGAGAGLLSQKLTALGVKCLAIDILDRDDPLHPVYPLDATVMQFPPACYPIMARPCHSEWIEQTVDNAMQRLTQFLYVGLPKNFDTDFEMLRNRYHLRVQKFKAGVDGERAVCIYRLPQFVPPTA